MRAAVLKEIISGKGPRQISRELFVSVQTIDVIKKSMDENSYRSYSERSKKERKRKEYSIDNKVTKPKYPGRPKRTKYGTIYMPY
jgi:FixJ family two-component response regulator